MKTLFSDYFNVTNFRGRLISRMGGHFFNFTGIKFEYSALYLIGKKKKPAKSD